ncbi:MAG TPA: YbgF trimerization domain-containing protein, partial [Burkholderiales bacterium]
MRRAVAITVLAAALAAPALTAPALAQGLFDDNEARRRIEVLRQQVVEGQRLTEERLAKIESAVGASTNRSAVLELAGQIESLRGEIARMRGQIEVATHQVELTEKRQKDLYLDIDTRLRKLEQAQEQAAAAAAQAAAQPPAV